MNILVIGSNGATGQLTVEELCSRGHQVTAFVRRPESWTGRPVELFRGDAMNREDVRRAVRGRDAVVIVLGIRENPMLVRIRGSKTTPINVRSQGTQNAVESMRDFSVRRLVVQTTFGAGETWAMLSYKWRVLFSLLLKPQIDDSEEQERIVRSSTLDWTIVRPVALTDSMDPDPPLISPAGNARSMQVSRISVARILADAATSSFGLQQCLAVSA